MTALLLETEAEYRDYFVRTYCRGPIQMPLADGTTMPVFFETDKFDHAFFESSARNGEKDVFSPARARQMPAIAGVLTDANATRLQGWDKAARQHSPTRCVSVVTEAEFVVIIRLGLTRRGTLRGRFVTCFVADNSFSKIIKAPAWTERDCLAALRA